MVRIYTGLSMSEADLLCHWLESHGIECTIPNELAAVAASGTVQVWILDETRAAEAATLTKQWLDAPAEEAQVSLGSWKCAECGERLEKQFTMCWNCGEERMDDKT
jgi:hypothetical protein